MNESQTASFRSHAGRIVTAPIGALYDVASDVCSELDHLTGDLGQLVRLGGMIYGRLGVLNDVRSPSIAENLFASISRKLERTDECRSELAELRVCCFLACPETEQRRLAGDDVFLNSLLGAFEAAAKDRNGPRALNGPAIAARLIKGSPDITDMINFAAWTMEYREEGDGVLLADCVMNGLLRQHGMTIEQRHAFIPVARTWFPYDIDEIDRTLIRQFMSVAWVPAPLKHQLAFRCSPLDDFHTLRDAFGAQIGNEFSSAMMFDVPPPVQIVMNTMFEQAAAAA